MVLTAYFVLSPVSEFVLSPSSADFRFCQTRSGRLNLRKFNTSNGCQDHTALPSAYSAVRQRAVNRSRGSTRPAIRHTPDAAASTASRPASVTIAIRPSSGVGRDRYRFDLGPAGTEIFLQRGLDSNSLICPSGTLFRLRARSRAKSQRRPGARRDPYAAASLFGTVANAFSSNRLRWLWVPAFAGTTVAGAKP